MNLDSKRVHKEAKYCEWKNFWYKSKLKLTMRKRMTKLGQSEEKNGDVNKWKWWSIKIKLKHIIIKSISGNKDIFFGVQSIYDRKTLELQTKKKKKKKSFWQFC